MDTNLCEIVVVLDRSGSMAGIAGDMKGGFDRFVREQAAAPGECRLTLVQFDSQSVDTVHENVPVAHVPPLVLEPRSLTPLLDAVGRTIVSVGQRLAATPEDRRPGRVLFLVITDGCENASTEYTAAQVKALVKHQEEVYRWTFSYLGANVDEFAESGQMGFSVLASAGYDPTATGVMNAFAAVSAQSVNYRGGGRVSYSEAERVAMKQGATAPDVVATDTTTADPVTPTTTTAP